MEKVLETIIGILVVVVIIVAIALWMHDGWVKHCEVLGDLTGHSTQYKNGECWLELCSDTWIAENDLPYYLDVCD